MHCGSLHLTEHKTIY